MALPEDLVERIESFRGHSAFYTWIFRIAVNLAISHNRKAGRRRTISLDAASDFGAQSQAAPLLKLVGDPSVSDPSQVSADRETYQQVAAALLTLDDEHRAVLVLRDVQGCHYQEIADILELAVGTVKSRIFRARMALRERVAPLMGDDDGVTGDDDGPEVGL